MLSIARSSGRLPLKGVALALGISVLFGSSVMADGDGHADFAEGRFKPKYLGEGTLGWAEYGLYPGLYGFSLRWHPGYGYGLYALGVGADGGYPFYGGPGYPHPWPQLRRCGPATPFAYYGGPEWPRDPLSNYFAGIGGLAIEKPVVTIGEPGDLGYVNEAGDVPPDRGFGPFTGAIPYPETTFAPYTSEAATTGSSGSQVRCQTADGSRSFCGRGRRAAGGFAVARPWRRGQTLRYGSPPGDRRGTGHRFPERSWNSGNHGLCREPRRQGRSSRRRRDPLSQRLPDDRTRQPGVDHRRRHT